MRPPLINNHTGKHQAIGDDNVSAIIPAKLCIAHTDILYNPFVLPHTDAIPNPIGALYQQVDTSQEILHEVLQGQAQTHRDEAEGGN